MWESTWLDKKHVFVGEFFVAVNGSLVGSAVDITIVNVYAGQDMSS